MKKRVMWRGVLGVSLVAGAVAVVAPSIASAGRSDAAQVINLRTDPKSTDVDWMVTVGSKVLFSSDDGIHGVELFITDGTLAGTKMVKDINPAGDGVVGGENSSIANVNGTLYFTANDGIHGGELWKSDGTEAGTVMVKDINPGSSGSTPDELVNLNGTLLFSVNDGSNGYELWKSDGTSAGTVMVKDINPGSSGSNPFDSVILNGTLYFSADDGSNGTELWKSDGTSAGTVLVQDVTPGAGGTFLDLRVAAGAVWFKVFDATAYEDHLYRYDGTTMTFINFGDGDPNQYNDSYVIGESIFEFDSTRALVVVSDTLGKTGYELWITDGTSGGTTLVKDINATGDFADSYPEGFVKMGTKVYFTANSGVDGRSLWVTNGTTGGTTEVKDVAPSSSNNPEFGHFTVVGSTLYFTANDGTNGEELWKSDGMSGGTTLVKDINPDSGSRIDPGNSTFQVLGTSLYFFADDGKSTHLWTSDGTDPGTVKLADVSITNYGSSPSFSGLLGSKVLFRANGGDSYDDDGLYVTDGTAAGTVRLADTAGASPVILGSKAYFGGRDNVNGPGLWETDGTPLGTKLVKDPNPSGGTQNIRFLTVAGSKLFFVANDGTNGLELWVSDGTTAGTEMVENIGPGSQNANIDGVGVLGSKLFFDANDGTNGDELWVSDGTTAGTKMFKDIDPGVNGPSEGPCYGPCDGTPLHFATVGSTLFFSAYTTTEGQELWKTNGTEAGTVLVKDIYPGMDTCGCPVNYPLDSNPLKLTAVGDKVYFKAGDGSGGDQLWTSDGTAAGTVFVKKFSDYSFTGVKWVAANNRLFFRADDGTAGSEPWVSDGTEAGTVMVKDITPGAGGSDVPEFVAVPNGVYFVGANNLADPPVSIWFSDGTGANTKVAVAMNQTDLYSGIQPYLGGLLYVDENATDGRELWSYGLPVGTAQTISFTPPANMKANEVVALTGTATSGLPVTYVATGQCEIKTSGRDVGKLKLKGQGFCTVRAMQGGDETWAAADDVEMTILIGKNSVVVKFIGVVPARKNSVSAFAFYSGRVQLKAQVTPALEGCEVQFDVSPNNATPAGPYTATSDEDGIVLSEPIVIGQGTYDFTVTPLGDCEGIPVDAPQVYLGELPPTGADTTVFVWIGVTLLAAGVLLVGRRRRTA